VVVSVSSLSILLPLMKAMYHYLCNFKVLTFLLALLQHSLGVHQSGRFVIVSNRGHESITIFRVHQGTSRKKGGKPTTASSRGTLSQVGFFHTRGETPRHFQFDHSGQYLIVANQDSDTIAVFSFNLTSGEIKYTGNEVRRTLHWSLAN
jgi:6-phosphogluconolactonase (cycloisomerase 2 family)